MAVEVEKKWSDLKVGDTVFVMDQNRRVYAPGGHSPIWREYWVQKTVIGETRVSWIIGHDAWAGTDRIKSGTKVSKLERPSNVILTEAELDAAAFVMDGRHGASRRLLELEATFSGAECLSEILAALERHDARRSELGGPERAR